MKYPFGIFKARFASRLRRKHFISAKADASRRRSRCFIFVTYVVTTK